MGEGEGEGGAGVTVGSAERRTWPATALVHRAWAAALLHEQGRAAGRGRRSATRLTGGAGWQRGPAVSDGCGRERGKRGGAAVGADKRAWLAQCLAARFKLNFKSIQNIQTVQMKFEFLQNLAGSKDTFPKILK
jgi:hypothetical protein